MPLPRSLLTASHHDVDLELVAGTWPDDLTGEMFISAPAPHAELTSALFGFGVMIRLSLRPGTHGAPADRFAWRTHVIDSPTKRLYDEVPDEFHAGPLGFSSPLGSPNMVNTAPLPWGDRLFATWDVGRPVELDPVTLGYLGEVGRKSAWGGSSFPDNNVLPFIFSSAHPVVDPDRDCLWTVKLDPGNFEPFQWHPSIVRYDGDGVSVRRWPLNGALINGTMHTITQTRDWLILADSGNFKADPGEMATGVRSVRIDTEVPVFLVRKDVLDATPNGEPVNARCCTLQPSTGHYYARWDDSDGIHVLFEHMDLLDLGYQLRPDDTDVNGDSIDPAHIGMYNMAMGSSTVSEVEIDPEAGTLVTTAMFDEDWAWNQQLSAMDWSTEGVTEPTLHHVVYQGWRAGAVTRRALNAYADRIGPEHFSSVDTPANLVSLRRGSLEVASRYEFRSTEDLPSSPIFVPRGPRSDQRRSRFAGKDPGGHDGYVVCPVLNDNGLRVEVFDARDVGAGPIASIAAKGHTVPLLLHAAWAPHATTAPDIERLRLDEDISADELASLSPELALAVAGVLSA
jgi:all-trans-8'-apo-beta-carotenal 15,15'-oxygenase